jgi:hypothetical protein
MRATTAEPLQQRSRLSRSLSILITFLLATFGAVMVPAAAHAAEIDAVTGITIINEPPLVVDLPYTFRATWAVPDSATAGDTFTVNFPAAVEGYSNEFDMRDPDGEVIGHCIVDIDSFVCTLSDYVDTHNNVSGWVEFTATFREGTTEDHVIFETGNGVDIIVPVDGGVGVPDKPVPTEVQKYGYLLIDGETIRWEIVLPGSSLVPVNGQPVVVTDAYDPALSFNKADLKVVWFPTSQWPEYSGYTVLTEGSGAGTYTVAERPAEHEFDVTINNPVTDGSRIYIIFIDQTVPTDAVEGDTFGNTVTGEAFDVEAWPVTYVDSDGGGDGDGLGNFAVTKDVTGTGAGVVGSQVFTVNYSYVEGGTTKTGQLTIADGQTEGLTGITEDTVVTLSEITPTTAGVTYGTPVFSGTGVTNNGDGTATFTIADLTDVAVTLTNPATLIPGGFEVTKDVTGTGATLVGAQPFTVQYSYTVNGTAQTGQLTVADGTSDDLDGVPVGTVVTLSEVAPTTAGVTYGTPEYTGTGVTDNGDGTATFTIGSGTVAIGLENPATLILGDFDVTKDVTGTGSALVGAQEFTVDYSYTLNGTAQTGEFTIADGQTDGLDDLPYGTVVTLSEVTPTTAGVTYGTPEYTGTGVTDNGDGTATFTIGSGTVAIGLENPATLILGGFQVTKDVTGTGATLVGDQEFTVEYSYTLNGTAQTGELTVADGVAGSLANLPYGTVVTLSEVTPTTAGVTYGTPEFTGTGVTDNGDGTATFTIGSGNIAIGLENPATLILGGFDVTKDVTGTGATQVGDQEFTVEYSYDLNGEAQTGEFTIADGQTDGLADLPYGTVVTLSEVAPTTAGVTYGTPVFSGTGVTDNGDGTATFTIGGGTIAIGLENPATLLLGGFDVTKDVTGTGSALVGTQAFTVEYSYDLNGEAQTGELTIADGQTDGLADLPWGTEVTLSEVAPATEGVMYGTPVYTGTGVTDNEDGTATLTIGTGTVAIGLENPATQILGGFAVTKDVTGTGTTLVGDQEFTVEYSYELDGETQTGEFTIADGQSDGLADLPYGTVVTLSEVAPKTAGVTYRTPVFTGTGVTDNGDGTASFTTGEGAVEVGLENPASLVPPPPANNLASTGSNFVYGATFAALGVALLVSGAAMTIIVARRRRLAE